MTTAAWPFTMTLDSSWRSVFLTLATRAWILPRRRAAFFRPAESLVVLE